MRPRFAAPIILTGSALLLGGCSGEPAPKDGPMAVGATREPILGGTAASVGDFPSVVGVVINGTGVCGGVLVTPTLVLSAAHCYDPTSVGLADLPAVAAATSVYFGVVNMNGALGAGASVATILLDPSYSTAGGVIVHDIALLQLDAASTVTPSPVNVDPASVPDAATLEVVGFGVTNPSSLAGSGVLRSVPSSTASCTTVLGSSSSEDICFDQSGGSGSCYDAGGPSFLSGSGTPVVAGIHSFGDQNCTFSVDARVDAAWNFLSPRLCASDGYCAPGCGTMAIEADPDCPAIRDGGTDGSISSGGASGTGGVTGSGGTAGSSGGTSPASGGTTAAGGGTPQGGAAGGPDAGSVSPAKSDSSSGCGCRVAPHTGTQGAALGALVGLLGLVRRSRSSRRRPQR